MKLLYVIPCVALFHLALAADEEKPDKPQTIEIKGKETIHLVDSKGTIIISQPTEGKNGRSVFVADKDLNAFSFEKVDGKKFRVTAMVNLPDHKRIVFDEDGDGLPDKLIKKEKGEVTLYKIEYELTVIEKNPKEIKDVLEKMNLRK